MKKEALLYEKLDNKLVSCFLCAHHCKIAEEQFGFCGVRQNIDGVLYTRVYGEVITAGVDPVEKKPLYHFLPGSNSFSFATIGCNFHCGFCQNWQISQVNFHNSNVSEGRKLSPEEIVKTALDSKCKSISYTYTEPTIFFEYALDTARLAKEKGLYNNFVTNGYMTKQALEMIGPYLDAANVDLKSFRYEFYRKICSAALEPVLESIRLMKEMGIWVEITTLIVPGENDSEQELRDIAEFIAGIDKNMPWHVSKFNPEYIFIDYITTPEKTLKKAFSIGKDAGLNYIYAGNVYSWGNDTYCHNCDKILIKRKFFSVLENHLKEGKCEYCAAVIPGKF
ncbi:MAG: AmmeMemoRadiSam system radical SAM enzyme [Candidatus Omnitrophota bacterium]